MSELLNPMSLPLRGSRLIEASAGTGKTYTIAALYLRLVLGHGGQASGFGRPLLPGEILVMSFTRAATRELSERIRSRLVGAAAALRGAPVVQEATAAPDALKPDAVLKALLQTLPAGPEREHAAWRLATAAEAMDDAAVHTIDAWCQRMLREHAFDSGCLFDEELQADETAVRAEALRDFWRQEVYPLRGETLAAVLDLWKDFGDFEKDVLALMAPGLADDSDAASVEACLRGAEQNRMRAVASLKAGWYERADLMQAWFLERLQDKTRTPPKGRAADIKRWVQTIQHWAVDPEATALELGAGRERLSHRELNQAVGADPGLTIAPCFAEFDALMAALDGLPKPSAALRAHAAAGVARRVLALKQQAGRFGHADMLRRLDEALDPQRQGERAERLRARILAQYPVALIDEFQDTSAVQLRVFERLYRLADDDPSRLLLLIGDPKQAIYSFRGADIHCYLQARRRTAGRHHVLGTNHRSTPELVAAVNALFLRGELRSGAEGAFLMGGPGHSELPFLPVQAQGGKPQLVCATGPVPPLTAVVGREPRGADACHALCAAWCAEHIVGLLNDAQAGWAQPGQGLQRVQPKDIAVLVRNRREADAVRRALAQRRVASVYLSDKVSVFQTPEAADVLRLLRAVAQPRQLRLARAALASALMARSLNELRALADDEDTLENHTEPLLALHTVWQHQGVMAMLRQALHTYEVPARLLAQTRGALSGERRLTNLLHLAELLQAASAQVQGEQALIRWLERHITQADDAPGDADERIVRLESDAGLVQVVTVHTSKGLQYPLVFLPFVAQVRGGLRKRPFTRVRPAGDEDGRVTLSPTARESDDADLDEQREERRLLYVALTRAQHAVWMGWPAQRGSKSDEPLLWSRSAIGGLISGPEFRNAAQRLQDIQNVQNELTPAQLRLHWLEGDGVWAVADAVVVADAVAEAVADAVADSAEAENGTDARNLPLPPITALQAATAATWRLPPREVSQRIDRSWAISSYSALVRDVVREGGTPRADSGAVQQPGLLEDEAGEAAAASPDLTSPSPSTWPSALASNVAPTPAWPVPVHSASLGDDARGDGDAPWHRFPRGALVGNFLHQQLEWLASEGFELDGSPALQAALQRRCERQGWGHRGADTVAWLRQVCATPLPPLGVPLSGVGSTLPEMEFWFPLPAVHTAALDALCRQHLLPGLARPPVPERELQGLLMGFADLVFEHGGRYWVLDHKSNALGSTDSHYSAQALAGALLEHRYDMQAALYLLALHRLLRTRLGAAYRPEQHLGGAVFLFLRGIHGPARGCCHLPALPALLEGLERLLPPPAASPAWAGQPTQGDSP